MMPSQRLLSSLGFGLLLLCSPASILANSYDQLSQWSELPERNIGRTPPNWVKNVRFGDGEAVLKSKGEGRQLLLSSPEGQERSLHLYYRELFSLPESGEITITLTVSGKGNVGAFCYLYDESEGALGIAPKAEVGMQPVPEGDGVAIEFKIEPPRGVSRKGVPASFRVALVVTPGSEVYVHAIHAEVNP